jgi:hypothetical protein
MSPIEEKFDPERIEEMKEMLERMMTGRRDLMEKEFEKELEENKWLQGEKEEEEK